MAIRGDSRGRPWGIPMAASGEFLMAVDKIPNLRHTADTVSPLRAASSSSSKRISDMDITLSAIPSPLVRGTVA